MELKSIIKNWNSATDLNDFVKSLKSSNLTKDNVEEFRKFLSKSYGKSFNTENIVEKIVPLAS